MWIIGAVIQILIAGVIFGFILQIAAKIIIKEGIDFSDAFKTAIVATAGIVLSDLGLQNLGLDGALSMVLSFLIPLVIWTLAMAIVTGLELVQSILIAIVFTLINWLIMFVFGLMLAMGMGLGSMGS